MVSYASSMRAYLEQRHHLQTLERRTSPPRRPTSPSLEREKARWDDPAYVRTQARERFGWVLPGEIGYQVIDEDGEPLGHDDSLSEAAPAVEEDERPLWWQAAWGERRGCGEPRAARPRRRARRPDPRAQRRVR